MAGAGEDEGACALCEVAEWSDDDPLLICDGCEHVFHASCYGDETRWDISDKTAKWFCRFCTYLVDQCQSQHPPVLLHARNKVTCVVCGLSGREKKGKLHTWLPVAGGGGQTFEKDPSKIPWCHIACYRPTKGLWLKFDESKPPIQRVFVCGVNAGLAGRRHRKCEICLRQTGGGVLWVRGLRGGWVCAMCGVDANDTRNTV